MPRQTSRPSTHDRQSVQDTVAEAIERDLTRVQARPMAVACNTIAAGGSRDEMARLAGCRGGHFPDTGAFQRCPQPSNPCYLTGAVSPDRVRVAKHGYSDIIHVAPSRARAFRWSCSSFRSTPVMGLPQRILRATCDRDTRRHSKLFRRSRRDPRALALY
jgi:hypothetical protein